MAKLPATVEEVHRAAHIFVACHLEELDPMCVCASMGSVCSACRLVRAIDRDKAYLETIIEGETT